MKRAAPGFTRWRQNNGSESAGRPGRIGFTNGTGRDWSDFWDGCCGAWMPWPKVGWRPGPKKIRALNYKIPISALDSVGWNNDNNGFAQVAFARASDVECCGDAMFSANRRKGWEGVKGGPPWQGTEE